MIKKIRLFSIGMLCILLAGCASQTATPTVSVEAQVAKIVSATMTAQILLTPTATSTPEVTATPTLPPVVSYTHFAAGTNLNIYSLRMFDTQQGWSVAGDDGNADHILRTADGGLSWQDITPPEDAPTAPDAKAAVGYFLDSTNGWVIYYTTNLSISNAQKPVIWHTSDGGTTWKSSASLDLSSLETFVVDRMQFVDQNNGWFLAHVGAGMSHDYIVLYKTTDGGSTWTSIVNPTDTPDIQSCSKTGFNFFDANNGWLTGDCNGVKAGVFLQHTTDGGKTWTETKLPAPLDTPDLYTNQAVDCGTYYGNFSNPQDGMVAVKCTFASENPVRVVNYLYTTPDSGQNWSSTVYPGGELFFSKPETGLALSKSINSTLNAGRTWAKVADVTWDGTFSMVNDTTGWAVSKQEGSSTLYQTTDGGKTWNGLKPTTAQ